jgi:hypothetical protein
VETITQQRIAVDLRDVLCLEIACDKCDRLTVLPLEDLPGRFRLNHYVAPQACPFCQEPLANVGEFQNAVNTIRQFLAVHRQMQGNLAIRLVVKQ